MATFLLEDQIRIGDYQRPYIVAEVNTSHNGNMELVYQMIQVAAEIGCNCVKFQSWSAESLYSRTYYDANPIAKRIVSKFSLSEDELLEAARFCKEQKISFASTPYSKNEVDFLVEKCGIPYIKVASMDLNNYPFLDYIAKTGLPVVLATGMGTLEEIQKAVHVFEKAGNEKLCILHCTSIYPADTSVIQLNNILGLRDKFPGYPIGFSDHSLGAEIPMAAVALGSAMIEKHFTLDNKKVGMDNQMATEPLEMELLIKGCHKVYEALGNSQRKLVDEELDQRSKMRRSVVAARDLKAGEILREEDMAVKRPGTGYPPERMKDFVGKVLKRDISSDIIMVEEDMM